MEAGLLEYNQIFGDDDSRSKIFAKYGTKCVITDFSILLGGSASSYYFVEEEGQNKPTGSWWTCSIEHFKRRDVKIVRGDGGRDKRDFTELDIGVRPVIPCSEILSKDNNFKNEILEIEYGEYPQDIVSRDLSFDLERLYQDELLETTGKNYTINYKYKINTYKEYEYNGKKYIRFIGAPYYEGQSLSNGTELKLGVPYWVEVSPIKWLVDKKHNIALSKKILFSGMPFDDLNKRRKTNYKKSLIYNFLNTIFVKDIIPSKTNQKEKSKVELLLEEINSYLNYLTNKEELLAQINVLINNYNNKLDIIKENENKKNNSNLSLYTVETLTNNLEISLSLMLDKLKNKSNYFELLNYLDECLLCINNPNQILDENNEQKQSDKEKLISDLIILFNYCIPFLNEEDSKMIKNDVLNIFNKEKENIEKYLSIKENIELKYSNNEELIIEIRKQLQPILEILNDKASKRNMELDITSATKEIIDNTFDISKERNLSIHLNEINKLSIAINELLNKITNNNKKEEYYHTLTNILSAKIDYTKSIKEILKQIENMIISLHKLTFNIESYLNNIEKINNSYVKPMR